MNSKLERFKNSEIVLNCETEEIAKELMQWCFDNNLKRCKEDKHINETNFYRYEDKTCYEYNVGMFGYKQIGYCDVDWYKFRGVEIEKLTLEDFDSKVNNFKLPVIEISSDESNDIVSTGVKLKINGSEILGARKITVNLGIGEVATVNIELIGKVNIEELKTIANISINQG